MTFQPPSYFQPSCCRVWIMDCNTTGQGLASTLMWRKHHSPIPLMTFPCWGEGTSTECLNMHVYIALNLGKHCKIHCCNHVYLHLRGISSSNLNSLLQKIKVEEAKVAIRIKGKAQLHFWSKYHLHRWGAKNKPRTQYPCVEYVWITTFPWAHC